MLNTVTVTLGEKEFEIKPLTIRKSKAWRVAFTDALQGLVGPLVNIAGEEFSGDTVEPLIEGVKGILINSTDVVLELLYAYSPALEKEREWIEENAYETEAFAAFMEVLKLAYPFVTAGQTLVQAGLQDQLTGKRSSEPNIDLSQKK